MSRLPVLSSRSPSRPPRGVVLVDMPWTRDKDPRVPLGHASILTSLRARGVPVTSVVEPINAARFSADRVLDRVLVAARRDQASVIALGAYVWCEHVVVDLLPRLRAALPNALIVVGGPQVSFADRVEGLYPDSDCVVRGAGERALDAIARASYGDRIPGVVWRGGTDAGDQARVDLANLASPFLEGTIPVDPGGFLRWETKRGCPFKCNFCQHRNRDARDRQRLSGDRVRAELALFAERGVADIAVLDPIFNDGARSLGILEHAQRVGLKARLSLQARLEMTGPTFLDATRTLDVRLEFGLQTIHDVESRAVERRNNMARVATNLAHVRAARHPFEISLIYGLPHQTLRSFRESVRWCLEQGTPVVKAFPLMLLRGTELERRRRDWGLVESDDVLPRVVASDSFGREEHAHMAALSEALRRTEGDHPSMDELLRLASRLVPERVRFTPVAA